MYYFMIHSSYDCSQALRDLDGSKIRCPDLMESVEPMIDFYRNIR